jgi:hypothetical protein
MLTSGVKYNVEVRDGDRWTVYTDAPAKGAAIQQAQKLLSTGQFDGAKVTEDRGQSQEILVWQEEGKRAAKALSIVPVEEAYLCRTLDDFYKLDSRLAIGRVLRQYLDQQVLTPLELLTDKVHLSTLMRNDQLVMKAKQAIATVQVKGTDQTAMVRLKFLEQMIAKIVARTDLSPEAAKLLPVLKSKGIAGVAEQMAAAVSDDNRDYIMLSAVSQYMAQHSDWEGKLELLLDLVEKPVTPETLRYLDDAMAEILDGSEAVRELLGYQRNLAAALNTMVQLSTGAFEINAGSNTALERFSAAMGKHKLIASQTVLLDRVARSLAGVNPLTKGDRTEEQGAFKDLMSDLLGKQLFSNSGYLCMAATLRAKSVLKDEFADESSTKAIDDMLGFLPTIAARLGYLLDLIGTEFGEQNKEHIVGCLAKVLASVKTVRQLIDRSANEKELITAAGHLRDRLLKADIPEDWRVRFAKKIYDLLIAHTQGAEAMQVPTPDPAANTKTNGNLNRREFGTGEYIFREGDEGDEAYLIIDGTVDIVKISGDQELVIAQVGKGAIIGEMALIDSEPRMASARAASETSVSVIPSDDIKTRFDRLQKFDPIVHRLMNMFVQRMREFNFIQPD